jgi:uncharacterized membrane protein YagU involved in acid resistance
MCAQCVQTVQGSCTRLFELKMLRFSCVCFPIFSFVFTIIYLIISHNKSISLLSLLSAEESAYRAWCAQAR